MVGEVSPHTLPFPSPKCEQRGGGGLILHTQPPLREIFLRVGKHFAVPVCEVRHVYDRLEIKQKKSITISGLT